MKVKRRAIKLLTKTTIFYLIFTFLVFFISAIILSKTADRFIESNVEKRFNKYQRRLERHFKANPDLRHLPPTIKIKLIGDSLAKNFKPVIKDTLIYNENIDDYMHYRKKITAINLGNRNYRVEFLARVEDYYNLRDDFLAALIPVFFVLALGVIIFNYFLSGFLFKPFNQILNVMKTYKVGQGTPLPKIDTNTSEFVKMQELFHLMMNQIENDYRHLKEYTENMAHEMQTPLAVIRNKIENLIADERVMSEHSAAVKAIYNEVNHLSRLGNALNLLTRIQNGEFDKAEIIKTKQIIEQHLQSVRELAELKGLKIRSELSAEHQMVIDPYLLDIILKNLLRNALHYGDSAGPIIVKTTADKLSVSNYGAPLKFPREMLFKRFFKQKDNKESLGLGLALVKQICDLNGLKIEYRYHEGQHTFEVFPEEPQKSDAAN
ncbi:MAG: HAMP domain-containing histidine kinase [Calditrichaeota bacterium]|nr:HAMP domain-containing histidine kinase [Calditrichota bacterium]